MIKFTYITTLESYASAINTLSAYPELAMDTETYALKQYGSKASALDPHTGRISLLQLKGRKGKTYIFDIIWLTELGADFSLLIELLQSREYLLGHHLKFDLKMILSTFGILLTNVRDTMLMAQLLSNSTGSKFGKSRGNSYKDLCRDLFNVHITGKGKEQVSEWGIGINSRNLENEWWVEKLQYAAVDVKYLFHIHDKLLPWIVNPLPDSPLTNTGAVDEWGFGMSEVLDREFRYLPLLAEREYIGMPVSELMLKYLQAAIRERIEDLAAELSIFFELDTPTEDCFGDLRATSAALKHLRSSQKLLMSIQKALKLNKLDTVQSKILSRILEIMDTLSALDSDDLSSAFIDEEEEDLYSELKGMEEGAYQTLAPIMQKIIEFKGLLKQDGMQLSKYINPVTGRIHSSFAQLGTATGRLSSSNCIAKEQRVMMADGNYKNIEDIQVGDLVCCWLNKNIAIRPVLNTFYKGVQETIVLFCSSHWLWEPLSIVCTPDHLILTEDNNWVPAAELEDQPLMYRFNYPLSVDCKGSGGMREVYDLEVEEAHNFIVEEVCVHNCNLQQVSHRIVVDVDLPEKYLFKH